MKISIFIVLLLTLPSLNAQEENSIFNRLQAINNNGLVFYNVDGFSITSQTLNYKFTEKGLKKVYRKYSIKKKDIKTKDSTLEYDNYYVQNTDKITDKLTQYNSYYFVQNENNRVTIIQFSSINKSDKEFENSMVNQIMKNTIPKKCFTSMVIDSINFAGRKIKLGKNCQWTNVNTG